MNILKAISDTIFTVITFVFVPLILFTLITSRTSILGGVQSFTVLSGSMSPLIPTGSIVFTTPSNRFDSGDIITFKRGNVNVTHRIVDTVNKEGVHVTNIASPLSGILKPVGQIFFKTKGDANNSPDGELVSAEKIIGKAQFHFPYLGKFSSFIRTPVGFLILIVLPTLMFIGSELWNIKKEIEKMVEKKTLEKFQLRYE